MIRVNYSDAFKEYISTDISLRELAKKYDVSKTALGNQFRHFAEQIESQYVDSEHMQIANSFRDKLVKMQLTKTIKGGMSTKRKWANIELYEKMMYVALSILLEIQEDTRLRGVLLYKDIQKLERGIETIEELYTKLCDTILKYLSDL